MSDEVIFSANRVRSVVSMLALGGLGLAALLLAPGMMHSVTHQTSLADWASNLLSYDPRVIALQVLGLVLLVGALRFGQLLIDSQVVFIDDDGIRVRYSFWERSGYWRDFKGERELRAHFSRMVFLDFFETADPAPRASTSLTVILPSTIPGVRPREVLAEVHHRLQQLDHLKSPAGPGAQASLAATTSPATRIFGHRGLDRSRAV